MKKQLRLVSLGIVMALWGVHLACPLIVLQNARWTFLGHSVPIYYFFTVLLMAAAATASLAFKRNWSRWEVLWWCLPLICLPGIVLSKDPAWSTRQCLSWMVRGVIPGGIVFLAASPAKSRLMLLNWIYPIVIAAAMLGLSELLCGFNPLRIAPENPITVVAHLDNPFYRPSAVMLGSAAPQGTQGNRIPFTSLLVGFFPLSLWLLKYEERYRWVHFLSAGILFLLVLLGQARSAWVAGLLALILLPIFGLYRNLHVASRALAVMSLCVGLLRSYEKTDHMIMVRYTSFKWDEASIRLRLDIFETARVLKDRWLAGVGFGQFPTECKPYYHGVHEWLGTADNQALRWATENGLPSTLLLLLFFLGLTFAVWREIQRMEDMRLADLHKSLLVGWLSITATFLFFDGFYWGACNMTFWCFLGLLASSLSSQKSTPRTSGKPPRSHRESE